MAGKYKFERGRVFERTADGKLARYTSIGGYTLVYVTSGEELLCVNCANKAQCYPAKYAARKDYVTNSDVYWERPPIPCD